MAHLAASMAEIGNQNYWDIAITVVECAWLPTEHLKLPLPIASLLLTLLDHSLSFAL